MDKTNKQEDFYSYHVFLFPFKWNYKENHDKTLEEQTDLKKFAWLLAAPESQWQQQGSYYPPTTLVQYNEVNFYYDFVRNALYDNGKQDSFLRHYRYQLPDDAAYCVTVPGDKTYRLRMDDILVHIYNTGVGVLSFHLYNKESNQKEDILKINQFGRRLFPPFFGTQTDKLGTDEFFRDSNWVQGLEGVKRLELPSQIRLEKNGKPFIIEDFHLKELPPEPGRLPAHITNLFPPKIFEAVEITPVLDDRMFVLCWYGDETVISEAKQRVTKQLEPDKPNYKYYCHDWWYQFIFVDGGGKTCQNDEMTVELLRGHTNARWINYGTLYGASRYSFVCLTSPISKLLENNAGFIVGHVQTMYYKMVELVLVQRACLLRFSDEVTEISKLEQREGLAERVGSLYRQYIQFVNKIYFREVTSQEQGIELYDLLQQHMRLERHVKDLDGEIQELHQYVLMMEEEKRNKNLETLTLLGAFFLVPTFVVGYFGMNVFEEKSLDGAFGWVLLCCLGLVLLILVALKGKGFWRWLWIVLFLIGLGGTLIFLPKIYPQ